MYRVIYWPKNALCIAGHWVEEALVVCVCVSSVAMGNLFIGQSKSGPGPRGVHRSNQMSLESTSVWHDQAVDVIESQPHRQGNEACVSHSLRVANWEICVHTRSGWLDGPFLSAPCSATLPMMIIIIITLDAPLSYLWDPDLSPNARHPLSIVDLPRTREMILFLGGFIKSRSDSHPE